MASIFPPDFIEARTLFEKLASNAKLLREYDAPAQKRIMQLQEVGQAAFKFLGFPNQLLVPESKDFKFDPLQQPEHCIQYVCKLFAARAGSKTRKIALPEGLKWQLSQTNDSMTYFGVSYSLEIFYFIQNRPLSGHKSSADEHNIWLVTVEIAAQDGIMDAGKQANTIVCCGVRALFSYARNAQWMYAPGDCLRGKHARAYEHSMYRAQIQSQLGWPSLKVVSSSTVPESANTKHQALDHAYDLHMGSGLDTYRFNVRGEGAARGLASV
ncbi:hypothetical protein B0H13DRAFT_1850116 [Mycena leptocephala]|nr:hypothetical protein B0H13DRAFT_1850116 [Mycena leptocephala]